MPVAGEKLYPLRDICKASGVNLYTVRNWVAQEVLRPSKRGSVGTGNGHQFGLRHALALAVGNRCREEGASAEVMLGVVHFLSRMTWSEISDQMRLGRTIPVPSLCFTREEGDVWSLGFLREPRDEEDSGELGTIWKRIDLHALRTEVEQKLRGGKNN